MLFHAWELEILFLSLDVCTFTHETNWFYQHCYLNSKFWKMSRIFTYIWIPLRGENFKWLFLRIFFFYFFSYAGFTRIVIASNICVLQSQNPRICNYGFTIYRRSISFKAIRETNMEFGLPPKVWKKYCVWSIQPAINTLILCYTVYIFFCNSMRSPSKSTLN